MAEKNIQALFEEILEEYRKAKTGIIWERSGSIEEDEKELSREIDHAKEELERLLRKTRTFKKVVRLELTENELIVMTGALSWCLTAHNALKANGQILTPQDEKGMADIKELLAKIEEDYF